MKQPRTRSRPRLTIGILWITLLSLFTVATPSPAFSYPAMGASMVSAGDWLQLLGGGVTVYSNGTSGGTGTYQCVELASRLYAAKGWGTVRAGGDGGAKNITGWSDPAVLSERPNDGTYHPKPGDLVVEGATTKNSYGHVAVVDSVVGTTINVVEQNASSTGRETYSIGSNGVVTGGYGPVLRFVTSSKNTGSIIPPPPVDSDGDGVVDSADRCPNLHGHGSPTGCPGADEVGVARTNADAVKSLAWYLGDTATISSWGLSTDTIVVGDWDGNGTDDMGVARANPDGTLSWHLHGVGSISPWGRTTDRIIIGDWDGNGADEIGVVRARTDGTLAWHLGSTATRESWGRVTDQIIIGDWDGNGADEIGVVRTNSDAVKSLAWYLGDTAMIPSWGLSTDTIVLGDWDGNRSDNIGVARTNGDGTLSWHLHGTGSISPWGRATDRIIIGDWDGNGADEIGVVRGRSDGTLEWYLGSTATRQSWGRITDQVVIGDWNGS